MSEKQSDFDSSSAKETISEFGESADGSSCIFRNLSMPCRGLTDLKSLEGRYVHLQTVDLQQNSITDLSCFQNMRHLLHLNVSYNKLTSFADFDPPLGLREMNVSFNSIKEIPDMSAYVNLTKLFLDGNQIGSIQGLSQCSKLKCLSLGHNELVKIAGLHLPSLEHLDLNFNEIEKIENLESVPNLTFLDLSGNKIKSLEGLEGLKNLGQLNLEANAVENLAQIDHIRSLRHLRSLCLKRNPVESLSDYREIVVHKLQQLNEFDLSKIKTVEKVSAKNRLSPSLEITAAMTHFLNVKQRTVSRPFQLLDCTLPDYDTPYPMLILIGPKGAGKSELARRIVRDFPQYFGQGVSHTTRLPRDDEVNGTEYFFVTKEEFGELLMKGAFIETCVAEGDFYGLSYDAVNSVAGEGLACVACMSLEGALSMKITHFQPRYVLVCPVTGAEGTVDLYVKVHQEQPGFFEQAISSGDLENAYQELKKLVLQFLALASEPTPASTYTAATHGLAQVFSRPSSSATGRSLRVKSTLDAQLHQMKLEQARAAAAGPSHYHGALDGRLAFSAPPSIAAYLPSSASSLTTVSNASQSQSLFSSISAQQNNFYALSSPSPPLQSHSSVQGQE